jgi:hypothetical protein
MFKPPTGLYKKEKFFFFVFFSLNKNNNMADESDPFECRLTFSSLLTKLNASQQAIQKVANYAMRHKNLSEDLYSCIIEVLEQVRDLSFFFGH